VRGGGNTKIGALGCIWYVGQHKTSYVVFDTHIEQGMISYTVFGTNPFYVVFLNLLYNPMYIHHFFLKKKWLTKV
jgi:hypothetical protein